MQSASESLSYAQIFSDLKTLENLLDHSDIDPQLIQSLKTAQKVVLSIELMQFVVIE